VWRVSNYKLSGRCSYSGVENECKDTMQYFHVRLWLISIVVQYSLLKSAYNFGMCRGVCINCYLILKWSTLYWLFPHYAWDLIIILLCSISNFSTKTIEWYYIGSSFYYGYKRKLLASAPRDRAQRRTSKSSSFKLRASWASNQKKSIQSYDVYYGNLSSQVKPPIVGVEIKKLLHFRKKQWHVLILWIGWGRRKFWYPTPQPIDSAQEGP
jgi:hypothetical protein